MLSEEEQRYQIQKLHQAGDWKGTLRFLRGPDCSLGGSLLWLRPDLSTLRWLSRLLTTQLDVDRVLSVGCGTGLLEWLLKCTSGVEVLGVELDHAWWLGRHSLGPFAPLVFLDDVVDEATSPFASCSSDSALLFCYFNDRRAFQDYLVTFPGRVCVIAGPGLQSGSVHCDPEPLNENTRQMLCGWTLCHARQVADTLDWIAVYVRD